VGDLPRSEAYGCCFDIVGWLPFAAGRGSYKRSVVLRLDVGAPPRGEAVGYRWMAAIRRGPAPYKRSVVLRFGVEGLLRGEAFFGSGSAKLNWRALTEGNPMTEKRYAAHKLRDGRWSSSGQIYLVTTVTNGRIPVFADFSAARTLIRVIRQDEQLGSHQTLCFVVMPDRLHWLLQLQSEDLARLVGRSNPFQPSAWVGRYGRRGSMIMRCAGRRMFEAWRDMWWQIL